jgi:hypothetical protein
VASIQRAIELEQFVAQKSHAICLILRKFYLSTVFYKQEAMICPVCYLLLVAIKIEKKVKHGKLSI